MRSKVPSTAYLDPRDPAYTEFDFDAYQMAMEEQAEREIEERLLSKYED